MNFSIVALSRIARAVVAATLLAAACGLGGCANNGAVNNAYAMAGNGGAGNGPTITFESIDGPPPQVFDRMVGVLDSESKLRDLSIVPRETPAAYRVRGYLSAQIVRGKTVIAWVWDVYDANQQRALRLAGEEPTSRTGRDAWAAADDLVLRKIAQAGLSGLSNMISGGPGEAPVPNSAPAGRGGPAVASAPTPENYGATALGYSAD